MIKPTDKELQEFWRWCGFEIFEQDTRFEHQVLYRLSPTDTWKHLGEVRLDLNNLFKYAVPRPPSYNPDVRMIQSITFDYGQCRIIDVMGEEYIGENEDPTQALYQAIQKARGKDEK